MIDQGEIEWLKFFIKPNDQSKLELTQILNLLLNRKDLKTSKWILIRSQYFRINVAKVSLSFLSKKERHEIRLYLLIRNHEGRELEFLTRIGDLEMIKEFVEAN